MRHTAPELVAEELVRETTRQLKEKAYSIDPEALYQSINTANLNPDSQKMQFRLSKRNELNQDIQGPNKREFWFFPRRILRNTSTDYKTNRAMTLLKRIEEFYFSKKTKGFDSSYVCRCAREDPLVWDIMQRAYARGSPYSLMGTLGEIFGADEDGRIAHDEKGELYVRKPVIIVPGAEPSEIKSLDEFCKRFQIPNQDKIDQILGIKD